MPDEDAEDIAPALADRLTRIGEERVFVLHRPTPDAEPAECVYLSQRDVRELQFAKAAIATGWSLLLEELGLEHRDVQQVLLAGSFGSYLSPASAVRIGLVPKPARAAHRRRGQRRRRGRQDGPAVACASGPARGRCWRRCPMSSSPTAPTSTTASSTCSPSRLSSP